MFHHHATVSGLTPHTKCFYKVGSKANPKFTSDVYLFVTARAAADNSTFSMVVYGDFGPGDQSRNTIAYVNSWSSDKVDLIYHIGDVGYADDDFLMPGQATGFYYEKVYVQQVDELVDSCHELAALLGSRGEPRGRVPLASVSSVAHQGQGVGELHGVQRALQNALERDRR